MPLSIEPAAAVPAAELGHAGTAPASLEQQVRRGLIWSAARTWGGRFASLLVFLVLARLLQPHEFGIFAIAVAVLAFLELLADQGLADAVVQRATLNTIDLNTAFAMNLAIALVLVAGIWLVAPSFASLMHEQELAPVLRYSSIGIVFFALGFCQVALLRRRFQYRRLAVRTVASTIGGGIVGIVMAFAGFGVWSLVGQFVVNTGIGALLLWTGERSWTPAWRMSRTSMKELATFGTSILGTRVLDFTTNRVIELALGFWQGAAIAGLYAVGARVYTLLLQMLGSTALDVALSGFARIRQDQERLTRAYESAFELSAAVAVPLFVLIAATAPELCVAVFGPTWEASGQVLSLLGLLGAVQVLQAYNRIGLNAVGRPDLTLALNGLSTVVTFVTIYPMRLHPLNELIGAFVAGQVLIAPVSFAMAHPYLKFSVRKLVDLALPFLLASTVAFFAVHFLRPPVHLKIDNAVVRLLLLGSAGTAAFVVSIAWIAPSQVRVLLRMIVSRARGRADSAAAGSEHLPIARQNRVFRQLMRVWRPIRPLRYAPGLYWQWWLAARRLRSTSYRPVDGSVLIVPPVSTALLGSKGDEAMLTAIVETLRRAQPGIRIGLLTGTAGLPDSLAAFGVTAEPGWAGVAKLGPLVETTQRYDSTITIGADVLDGGYAPITALRLWLLADLVARSGRQSIIAGFSFNSRASRFLLPALRFLDRRIQPMVRDQLSIARFKRRYPGTVNAVADVAFLMTPRPGNATYVAAGAWVSAQRSAGHVVLGLNLCPLLVGSDNVDLQTRLTNSAIRALEQVIEKHGVSVMLISHDYRGPGVGDDIMMRTIETAVAVRYPDRVLFPSEHQHAAELRALASLTDVIITGRMHLAIGALAEGVPIGGVFYQDKFQGLFDLFDLPMSLLLSPAEASDPERFEHWIATVVASHAEWRGRIASRLPDVQALARLNLATLIDPMTSVDPSAAARVSS